MADLQAKLTIQAGVKGTEQIEKLSSEIKSTENTLGELKGELNQTANTANQAAKAVDDFGDKTKSAGNKADDSAKLVGNLTRGLGGLMGALGVSLGVQEVIELADEFNNLEARVRIATQSGGDFNHAMASIREIANQTSAPLSTTGELFNKLTSATKDLGYNQNQVVDLTRTISQAMAVSGGSAQSMDAAITQLAQGLSAGALRGDEFNSVVEQSPRLAQAMADGLGVSIGQLREMANNGELTAQVVGNALKSQADVIAKEFAQMPLSVSGSLTVLKNSLMSFIGEMDNELSGAEGLANFIKSIADGIANIDYSVIAGLKNSLQSLGEIVVSVYDGMMVIPNAIGDIVGAMMGLESSAGSLSLLQGLMNGIALTTGAVADGIKAIQLVITGIVSVIQHEIANIAYAFSLVTGRGKEFADNMAQSAQKSKEEFEQMAMGFESSFVRAMDGIGTTSQERLQQVADDAKLKFDEMAQSGTASAVELENAFKDYAHKAIKANDGVVDSTLKQELAQRNLQAVTDDTGKVIISAMDDAKNAVGGVDFSKYAASFKALGLEVADFAGELSDEANTALSAFNDLAKLADGNVNQLAIAYGAAKAKIGDNSAALLELDNRLLKTIGGSHELANGIKALADAQMDAKNASDNHARALSELGINMNAINAGMSDGGQKIAQSLSVGLTAIKQTATSADALKTALSQAFDTATAKAQTVADFTAIKQAISDAGLTSQLTAAQMQLLNAGIQGGSAAVKQAMSAQKQATDETTVSIDNQSKAIANNTTAQAQNITTTQNATTATKSLMAATLDEARAKFQAALAGDKLAASQSNVNQKVSAGAGIIGAYYNSISSKLSTLTEFGVTAQNMAEGIKHVTKNMGFFGGGFDKFIEKAVAAEKDLQSHIDSFKRLAERVDNASQSLSGADLSTQSLARAQSLLGAATRASVAGIARMDDARLDNLRAQIQAAKDELRAFADEARQTADSLDGELARMQGNDKKAQELENNQKIKDLEKKLADAERRGNAQEISEYQRALNIQRKINSEKIRDIEQQAREQQAREQQARAEAQRQEAQSTPQTTPSATPTSAPSAKDVANAFGAQIEAAKKDAVNAFAKQLMDEAKRQAR